MFGIDYHPMVETPTLDQLALRGARSVIAYTATPSCVPARVALMTLLDNNGDRRAYWRKSLMEELSDREDRFS